MSLSPMRVLLQSSMLASITYLSNATLEVEFCRGAVYQYFDVPRAVFDELINAGSVGAYFSRHVRSRFRSRRVA